MPNLRTVIQNLVYRFINKKTLGVRVMLINGERILLVKHTYTKYWYVPGGAVDAGETTIEAAKREVLEEVNIKCEQLELLGIYYSNHQKRDDYVAVYYSLVDSNHYQIDNKEISEAEWFSYHELPKDISPATKRRIEEYFNKTPKSDRW